MKRFTQQFHKEAQKISLTAREREELLSRVEAYMEYHPLPQTSKTEVVTTQTSLKFSEPMRLIRISRRFIMASTTVTAMFLFVVVPAMAEQSMPGNLLHPIKIHINEEIRGAFLSGEERVQWETERVERRLAEARRLAVLGRLTPEIEARVAESVTKQSDVAREQIATLETADADAATMATMAMASMFEVQETLLDAVRVNDVAVSSELSRVIESSREETKARGDLAVVSEAKLAALIEQQATRAYEILLGLEKELDKDEQANLTRRLNDIERTLVEYTSGVVLSEEEKMAGLRENWSSLQKLISYMNSMRDDTSVAVEQVVPMRLTYDERVQKLKDQVAVLNQRYEKLLNLSNLNPEVESLEKVRFVLPDMAENLARIDDVNPGNIKVTEESITEVRQQIDSLEKSIPLELWRTAAQAQEETETEDEMDDEEVSETADTDEDIIESEVDTATTTSE